MTRHCWDLNPNFWMTTEPGSPRNSVLPWAHIQCPFDPGRGTVTSHLPGPRNALQSPQRAPSGTSPPPVAAVHVPAPRRPRCPLRHREPGQPSGPTPVMQSEIPPPDLHSADEGQGSVEGAMPSLGPGRARPFSDSA